MWGSNCTSKTPAEKRKRKHSPGFTLVEVIVVTGILMLLAAIFLPALARVRGAGQANSCRSNERQIGLAMEQYLADWENCYPSQDQTPGNERCFEENLQPYLHNLQVFCCPSAPHSITIIAPPASDALDYTWRVNGYLGSYGMNGMLQNLNASKIRQPALTAVLLDDRTFADIGFYPNLPYSGRHAEGLNVCYADGHVKWMSLSQAAGELNFFW